MENKLIVALDVPHRATALQLVDELEGLVSIYKVGWQLFMTDGLSIVTGINQEGGSQAPKKEVFLDLKLDDIPNTVEATIGSIWYHTGIRFFSLQGDIETFRAAKRGSEDAKHSIQFLHVPALSSRSESNYLEMKERAAPIVAQGGGLIASGAIMVRMMRGAFPHATIVVPGIRPTGADQNDHTRLLTPTEAIKSGADYLVVGRPIINASDPRQAAKDILEEIDGL